MSHASHRSLAVGMTLGLTLLAAACADPTAPATNTPHDIRAAQNGDGSGATIVRGIPFYFGIGAGGGTPFVAQVGTLAPIEEVCANPAGVIGSAGHPSQIMFTPSGGAHILWSSHATPVQVFQFAGGIVTDPCQLVGAPIVATGTVSATWREEDGSLAGGQGANVIHATVRGIVTLTSGGQARLDGSSRIVILPDGTLRFDVEVVHLTPL